MLMARGSPHIQDQTFTETERLLLVDYTVTRPGHAGVATLPALPALGLTLHTCSGGNVGYAIGAVREINNALIRQPLEPFLQLFNLHQNRSNLFQFPREVELRGFFLPPAVLNRFDVEFGTDRRL